MGFEGYYVYHFESLDNILSTEAIYFYGFFLIRSGMTLKFQYLLKMYNNDYFF